MTQSCLTWEKADDMFTEIYDNPGLNNIVSIESELSELICFNNPCGYKCPDYRFLNICGSIDELLTPLEHRRMKNAIFSIFGRNSTLYIKKNDNDAEGLSLVVVINALKFTESSRINIYCQPSSYLYSKGELDLNFKFEVHYEDYNVYEFSIEQMELRQMLRHYKEYLGEEKYQEIRDKCYKALCRYKTYVTKLSNIRDSVEQAFSFTEEEKLLFEVIYE